MQHEQGAFRGAGDLELFYQRWRPEGAVRAALVLVHGLHDHSDRFLPIVERLVPGGYAIYGLDARGHGRSPGRRGHVNRWSEYREDLGALYSLTRAAEPDAPLFVMGHSLGGATVLEYALRQPAGLSGVIAVNPAIIAQLPPVKVAVGRLLSGIWPSLSMDPGLDFSGLSRIPEVVAAHRTDPLRYHRATVRLGTEFFAVADWIQAHAHELQVPLCLFHGTADRITSPEGSREFFRRVALADKELKEYAGGYHVPFHDINQAEFLADLEGWLDRHTPA